MTTWLSERISGAPQSLRIRLDNIMAESQADGDRPDALADAAVTSLTRLLATGDESRAIAGDLLAIDALVTYACEAAAERWEHSGAGPEALIAWCDRFAARIAAIPVTRGVN